MQTKNELREKAKEIRNSLDTKIISEKIVKKIKESEFYKQAKHIMIFYPLKNEINLLPLIDDDDKSFYLPKIDGENMLVCPFKQGDEMSISDFKTKEPICKEVNPDILNLIFVPALMIDKENQRLGYGKGFYDRFLSNNAPHSKKIVPIANQLIIEKLPAEDFDKPIDIVITEL